MRQENLRRHDAAENRNISFVDRLDALTGRQKSAMEPQEDSNREFPEIRQVLGNEWLGGRDSNPDTQIQSLQSYH
jgi:hypothetical protein